MVAIDLITEHIRIKMKQHDLLRIYPNLEVSIRQLTCSIGGHEHQPPKADGLRSRWADKAMGAVF